ncbi:MAG: response regulator [Myxococcales bacterium]|nr:response regulator [Myxococcales bacterium]
MNTDSFPETESLEGAPSHAGLTLSNGKVRLDANSVLFVSPDDPAREVVDDLIAHGRSLALVMSAHADIMGCALLYDLVGYLQESQVEEEEGEDQVSIAELMSPLPSTLWTQLDQITLSNASSRPPRTRVNESRLSAPTTAHRGLVLLVEDDEGVAESAAALLEGEGYDVLVAADGLEAIAILRSLPAPPGLIILDLMMPRMNGWEFRKAQREDESMSEIPLIVMTAHAHRFDGEQLDYPAAILRKPVNADVLLDAIDVHFRDPSLAQ